MLAASEAESASEKADSSIHEGRREAHTWSFRACVRLKDGQTFSNLLDARKQQLDTSLASASVIAWACTNTAPFEFQVRRPSPRHPNESQAVPAGPPRRLRLAAVAAPHPAQNLLVLRGAAFCLPLRIKVQILE